MMTTEETRKLIRWLLLEAEDINEAFEEIKEYELHTNNKNEIGLTFKW